MTKKFSKKIGLLGAICIILCALVVLVARPWQSRTISVSGTCLTTAPRDRTAITLRIKTLDKSAAQSIKMATSQVAEITDFLKTAYIELQTTGFDSYEKKEWNQTTQKYVPLGIETTISLEISATNISEIEKVLNQFAGRENIFSENLRTYTSAEVLQPIIKDCLESAVKNARERANSLAKGDGGRAGKMLSVSYDSDNPRSQPRMNDFVMLKSATAGGIADADASGVIVSKDTDISINIYATFELK